MDNVCVHRVNFFELNPKAIHCLAYDDSSSCLAVSRSDFSIELWNVQHKPFIEKVIPGNPIFSVESIVWYKGRLLSGGLHGQIIEYDLTTLKHKYDCPVSTGTSIWCLGIHEEKALLAAGTEGGHISLYSVDEDGLNYEKTFRKQEGRILCLAWHKSGDVIVTGSIDSIAIWNVATGHQNDRILVGRSEKKVETIVWCIAVTSNMTIVSGDSRGKLSFWDGNTGTLLCTDSSHKADVLTLCLSKDEKFVYSAGVDPAISIHTQSNSKANVSSQPKWIMTIQRRIHTHDVRALLLVGEYLISGGVDSSLSFSKYPPKIVFSFSPFSQMSYSTVASGASLILLKYLNQLEVWKLGKTTAEPKADGMILPLDSQPEKLLQMNAKEHETILCSDISSDGTRIAYSTLDELKLFCITMDNSQKPVIKKVKLNFEEAMSCRCLVFIDSNRLLITKSRTIAILVCDTECSKIQLLGLETNNSSELDSNTELLAVSPNKMFVASGLSNGIVRVHKLEDGMIYCNLPQYKCPPTAMKFNSQSKELVVVYSDKKVVEYDLEARAYSEWCRRQNFTTFQNSSFFPIRGISFILNKPNLILLYEESAIYVFDKSVTTNEQENKRSKQDSDSYTKQLSNNHQCFRTLNKYKYLLDFLQLENGELVAVEIPPCNIQDLLPPPLYQKKYGT